MPFSNWENLIKKLSISSRSVAYGLWDEDGVPLHLNEVFQDMKSMNNGQDLKLINPNIKFLLENKKENECIFVGYLVIGANHINNTTIFSKIFYKENSFLVFSYLDIIETINDNIKLSKLNQEVNNLQRKLTKEKLSLENALEELHVLQSQLLQRSDELEKTNDALYLLNQEKNKYIGMVAHDLRSPIGIINSFANLMMEDFDTFNKNEIMLFLQKIIDRSVFSLNMIEEFLDTSKIESGILEIKSNPNDIIKCINQSIENNLAFANAKNQDLIFKKGLEKFIIKFDWDKIQQVMDNILSNAIKYSEHNTQIFISVNKPNDKYLEVEVQDQGQGIAENEIHKVFKAFEITSAKATGGEKSTGLGMAIVKKIIEAHHGFIHINSKPGKGTIIKFELPLNNS